MDVTTQVNDVYKNLVNRFDPTMKKMYRTGQALGAALQHSNKMQQKYAEAVSEMAECCSESNHLHDYAICLKELGQFISQLNKDHDAVLTWFTTEMLAPIELNLKDDVDSIKESWKSYRKGQQKINAKLKKSSKLSLLNTDNLHSGAERVQFEALNAAVKAQRKRYSFVLHRHVDWIHRYKKIANRAGNQLENRLPDWSRIALSHQEDDMSSIASEPVLLPNMNSTEIDERRRSSDSLSSSDTIVRKDTIGNGNSKSSSSGSSVSLVPPITHNHQSIPNNHKHEEQEDAPAILLVKHIISDELPDLKRQSNQYESIENIQTVNRQSKIEVNRQSYIGDSNNNINRMSYAEEPEHYPPTVIRLVDTPDPDYSIGGSSQSRYSTFERTPNKKPMSDLQTAIKAELDRRLVEQRQERQLADSHTVEVQGEPEETDVRIERVNSPPAKISRPRTPDVKRNDTIKSTTSVIPKAPPLPASWSIVLRPAEDNAVYYKATHSYSASGKYQQPLAPGDRIKVIKSGARGWAYGENVKTARRGWFPVSHAVEEKQ